MELNLTQGEQREVFGDFDPSAYAAEAEERWGGSDAWKQSQRRTASYTKEDWKRFTGEAGEISQRLAALMADGIAASDARAMDLAEEHRLHLDRWCYDCGYELHRGLGDLYVTDARFTTSIDQLAPGLAAYTRAAIHANATRHNS